MHSKTFVADDEVAVVGTINLDYRSLYLHFENGGVWLYKTPSVMQIKDDFLETLHLCQEVELSSLYTNLPALRRLKWAALRLLAPPCCNFFQGVCHLTSKNVEVMQAGGRKRQ